MTKIELPTGERPTLKTIAFMTGLGLSTVSQALKNGPDISRATKGGCNLLRSKLAIGLTAPEFACARGKPTSLHLY